MFICYIAVFTSARMSKSTIFLRLARICPSSSLRISFLRRGGIQIGSNVKIDRHAIVWKESSLADNVEIRTRAKVIAASIGKNSVVDVGAQIHGVSKNKIVIGEHTYIGINNILDGSGGLKVGNHVHIAGPSVGIWTHSTIDNVLMGSDINDNTHRKEAPVVIEDNVWIGGLSIIYPGVTIGHHSVVLPNSVVNRNVSPYTVVGGSPAVQKKKLKPGEKFSA